MTNEQIRTLLLQLTEQRATLTEAITALQHLLSLGPRRATLYVMPKHAA